MAHFMSNENNDDNDNCETTIQNVVERNQRWKTILVFNTMFKVLGIEFLYFNKAILNSKQVQHP